MTTVAVLGCGLIGSSWVQAFLAHGMRVRAWDPDPVRATALRSLDGVELSERPEEAVRGASFIQENGPEDMEKKHRLYAMIADHIAADAIVASSTSTLRPTQLQEGISFGHRLLVGHPFNPPHLLPLVEVVGGSASSAWALDRAEAFYRSVGKYPIRLRTERVGHLANRLQAALWREAIDAVATGQATVKDVDAAVTLALGPRWAVLGPFATFHLGGGDGGLRHFLDHLQKPFEAIWDDAQRPTISELLESELINAVAELFVDRSANDLIRERNDRLNAVLSITRSASWSTLVRDNRNTDVTVP